MVEKKDKNYWFGFIAFASICLCAGETIYKTG